jgi:hypothetical protein
LLFLTFLWSTSQPSILCLWRRYEHITQHTATWLTIMEEASGNILPRDSWKLCRKYCAAILHPFCSELCRPTDESSTASCSSPPVPFQRHSL